MDDARNKEGDACFCVVARKDQALESPSDSRNRVHCFPPRKQRSFGRCLQAFRKGLEGDDVPTSIRRRTPAHVVRDLERVEAVS